MPEDFLPFSVGLDPVTIIVVCAFAAVMLILGVLALVALLRQNGLLKQIHAALMRQGAPIQTAPSYVPPSPNICARCGAVHAPGAAFCPKCGASLKG